MEVATKLICPVIPNRHTLVNPTFFSALCNFVSCRLHGSLEAEPQRLASFKFEWHAENTLVGWQGVEHGGQWSTR